MDYFVIILIFCTVAGTIIGVIYGIAEQKQERQRIEEEAERQRIEEEAEKRRLAEIKRMEEMEEYSKKIKEERKEKEEQSRKEAEEKERQRKEAEEIEKRRLAEEERKKEEALIKLAEQGGGQEKYKLAEHYANKNQWTEAIDWFEKAAEQNYIPAQYRLGFIYLNGIFNNNKLLGKWVIEKNINEAVYWFKRAADQGDIDSQCEILYLYFYNGVKIETDLEVMLSCIIEAAKNDHERSMLLIACLQADNIFPNSNYQAAFRIFEKILEKYKNPIAMIYLGEMYCSGKGTTFLNPVKGVNYIEEGMKSCKEILSSSLYFRIAMLYYEGKTTDNKTPNFEKAIEYLEKASINGDQKIGEYYYHVKREKLKNDIENYENSRKYFLRQKHDEWNSKYNGYLSIGHTVSESEKYANKYAEIWDETVGEYNEKINNARKQLEELDKAPSLDNKKNDIFDW